MTGTVPPGWPRGVRAPGVAEWERAAVGWLLDNAPPEFRGYAVLRRHPVLLARFVVLYVEGQQDALKRGLSEARSELKEHLGGDAIDAGIEVLHQEGARLLGIRRSAGLVEEALRGRRFTARL